MATIVRRSVSFAFIAYLASSVLAVPSPQSIGSDLTILTHNDLYGS
jgi:hypothetical protein